jgi:phage tail tape-measure protein
LLVACRGQADGVRSAEVLPMPLTGVVLTIGPRGHVCGSGGCFFDYTLRLTNPMDQDAQVRSCDVTGKQVELPLNTVSGVDVKAGATRKVEGSRDLPKDADRLAGSAVTCEGLDWHGDPPV